MRADFEIIKDICLTRDPSFNAVDPDRLTDALAAVQAQTNPKAFILSAMRCLALAGNGHTRIMPNPAVNVFALRVVSVGTEFAARHDGKTHTLSANTGDPEEEVNTRTRPAGRPDLRSSHPNDPNRAPRDHRASQFRPRPTHTTRNPDRPSRSACPKHTGRACHLRPAPQPRRQLPQNPTPA